MVEQTELVVLGRNLPPPHPAECSLNWWYHSKKGDVSF